MKSEVTKMHQAIACWHFKAIFHRNFFHTFAHCTKTLSTFFFFIWRSLSINCNRESNNEAESLIDVVLLLKSWEWNLFIYVFFMIQLCVQVVLIMREIFHQICVFFFCLSLTSDVGFLSIAFYFKLHHLFKLPSFIIRCALE
jgi:hypothetical protein